MVLHPSFCVMRKHREYSKLKHNPHVDIYSLHVILKAVVFPHVDIYTLHVTLKAVVLHPSFCGMKKHREYFKLKHNPHVDIYLLHATLKAVVLHPNFAG